MFPIVPKTPKPLMSELVLILFNVLAKLKHLWRQRGSRDPAAAADGRKRSISAEGRPAADEEEEDAGAGVIIEVSRFLL
jgi:hypothetical protein